MASGSKWFKCTGRILVGDKWGVSVPLLLGCTCIWVSLACCQISDRRKEGARSSRRQNYTMCACVIPLTTLCDSTAWIWSKVSHCLSHNDVFLWTEMLISLSHATCWHKIMTCLPCTKSWVTTTRRITTFFYISKLFSLKRRELKPHFLTRKLVKMRRVNQNG